MNRITYILHNLRCIELGGISIESIEGHGSLIERMWNVWQRVCHPFMIIPCTLSIQCRPFHRYNQTPTFLNYGVRILSRVSVHIGFLTILYNFLVGKCHLALRQRGTSRQLYLTLECKKLRSKIRKAVALSFNL